MAGVEFISIAKFSKKNNIPRTTIQKAIESERITSVKRSITGKVIGINKKQALKEFKSNTDPVRSNSSKQQDQKTTYNESRAMTESFRAKTAELEYLEKAGILVSIEQVEKEMTEIIMLLKSKVFRLPEQLANELVVLTDIHKTEQLIRKNLISIFEETSDELKSKVTQGSKKR